MTGVRIKFAAAACASFLVAPAAAQAPLRLIDAHTHVMTENITPDEEVALLKKAGINRVVFMHNVPEELATLTKKYPGFVIPALSVSRNPTAKGVKLDENTGATLSKLFADGAICVLGEVPGRFDGPPEDVAKYRRAIYAAANANSAPINAHLDFASAETLAFTEQALKDFPKAKFMLAHLGWTAGPELMGRLLDTYPNAYTDVSIRFDAPGSLPWRNNGLDLSILTADGGFQPGWRELIERHPDRFLFAMDINSFGPRYTITQDLADTARKALAKLTPRTRLAVAHGNIQRILNGCGAAR